MEKFDFDDVMNLGDIFFDKIFPYIKGHAKRLDKYLCDKRALEHVTYTNDNMCFHDPRVNDPYWEVRQC
jgi:hypothetical protein